MHGWAKEIMECVKSEIKEKGIDEISLNELEELRKWTDVAENIVKYDYYYHIVEAMEKPENKYGVNYDEHGHYEPRRSMAYPMSQYDKAKDDYISAKKNDPNTDMVSLLDDIFSVVESDVKDIKPMMSASEKAAARNKFSSWANIFLS